MAQYFIISYSIHQPLEIFINSIYIFGTAGQAHAFLQKELQASKQVTGSQLLDLPQPMGDESFATRGSGSPPSFSAGASSPSWNA